MASTALTFSMSFTALMVSGLAMWRAEPQAATRPSAQRIAPVTTVSVPAVLAPAAQPVAAQAAPTPVQRVAPAPSRVEVQSPVDGLAVRRLAVGTGIENREAAGHASEYELTQTTRFCAVMEMSNRSSARSVRVRFEPDGRADESVGMVRLAVPPSQRYRTWGCTERIRSQGTWSAVVETLDGHELAREVFTVR